MTCAAAEKACARRRNRAVYQFAVLANAGTSLQFSPVIPAKAGIQQPRRDRCLRDRPVKPCDDTRICGGDNLSPSSLTCTAMDLFWIGLALFVFGTGPLLTIILAASLGLLSDPNPNPIGPGMLAGITFWPAVILITWGLVASIVRCRKAQTKF
jgi:hypothetical protein